MKLTYFIFIISIMLVPFSAYSEKIDSINIATEEWEDCTNSDLTGLYFDIIRAVYDPEKIKLNAKILPYARSVEEVKSKKADAFIGSYINEVKSVLYPKWHFSADDVEACFLAGSGKSWAGEKTLAGKKVAWLREYNYDKYLAPALSPVIVDKRENAINLLLKNRIDYYLDAKSDIEATIEEMGLDRKKFDIRLIKYLNLYVCFADTPKGKSLRTIWDKNMEKLIKSGMLKPIFEKWDSLDLYNY
jgi:polar amino acid transport system substrate-binding protein